MITDAQIDLTVERKFNSNRIRTNPFIMEWGRPNVPWRIDSEKPKSKRSYGDYISDNFGMTLRRTSNNKWLVLGDNHFNHFDLVFDEFINEELGGLLGDGITRCIRCGKSFIAPNFSKYECNECIYEQKSEISNKLKKRTYQQIPWDQPRVFNEWRDNCLNHLNEIREKIVEYSIHKKINDIETTIMSLEDTNV